MRRAYPLVFFLACASPKEHVSPNAEVVDHSRVASSRPSSITMDVDLPSGDLDGDGLPDDEDYCPTLPGYFPSGCPDDAGRPHIDAGFDAQGSRRLERSIYFF